MESTLPRIEALLERSEGPRVSIFQPAVRSGPEVRQNRIRFRNLIRRAGRRLDDRGLAIDLPRRAREILGDRSFWRHPGEGLCVLIGPKLVCRSWLPIPVAEEIAVDEEFRVGPILPLYLDGTDYDVLAVARQEVRLLRGNRFGLFPVDVRADVDRVRRRLEGVEFEKELQYHSGTPGRGGTRDAIFFGTGGADRDVEEEARRWSLRLDDELAKHFRGERPLVLCGVGNLPAIFRSVSSHSRILAETLAVDAIHLDPAEVHARTWPIVRPRFDRDREAALGNLRRLAGRGDPRARRRASAILPEATRARVGILFVVPSDGPSDDDRARDATVIETLRHGGRVHVVSPEELSPGDGVAAILRF
ncbi:MAG: hypothetical protein R3B81_14475 [bacterium]